MPGLSIPGLAVRLDSEGGPHSVTLFYGWVIVGVGIVVTCIGMGAMMSLSIFLQPISEAMGWSRTGISTAALLNFLAMGVGGFALGCAVRPLRHARGRPHAAASSSVSAW